MVKREKEGGQPVDRPKDFKVEQRRKKKRRRRQDGTEKKSGEQE